MRLKVVLCLLVIIAVAACATTNLGKSIQAADVQKRIVENATVELLKLRATGQLADADYVKARAAYDKWAAAQTALAVSLSKWRSVQIKLAQARVKAEAAKSAENEQAKAQAEKELAAIEAQLAIELSNVQALVDAYLAIVVVWVDKNKATTPR